MSILIKNATIVQEGGAHHLKKKDIHIHKGVIQKIGKSLSVDTRQVIEGKNLHVSIGWCDIGTHSGEPGFEHRETIKSLKAAAAAGGYSAIAVFPNTNPIVDNSTALKSLSLTSASCTKIYPIGALSIGTQAKDLSEFLDMNDAGAIAYSDGLKSIDDNGLLMRALQYAKSFEGLVIHHPNDHQICSAGEMHEGAVSTSLGLTGIPTMAELSHVERDLSLLEYTESKLLIHLVSAADSIQAIKRTKKKNQDLFCSVSYMNLISNDQSLLDFDSNYKLVPPLRTATDQKALIKAIKDQTIDVLCSNHMALEDELKKDAFTYTTAGSIGLQTCFSASWDYLKDQITISQLVELLAVNPRKILNIPVPQIKENEKAELCIFDLDQQWTFNKKENKSLSTNSSFLDKSFSCKVIGVINGNQIHIN